MKNELPGNNNLSISDLPKLYIETYGCQMNVNDSEVVASIMIEEGFTLTDNINESDVILINTCSVRENAEQRVWGRLELFKQVKKKRPSVLVGVIGCMAERLKEDLIEKQKIVDLVIGPDSYRELPFLIKTAETGQKAVNVLLSSDEMYADINPVRLDKNNLSAFVSIMRGCNNMCSYCVVPYTRGAERSRDTETIVAEVRELISNGYKEVTLLGQNVDSYHHRTGNETIHFADLLGIVAKVDPGMRVRFSTSHPKDITDEVLYTMSRHKNICRHIHLPFQSGSNRILKLMNRKYTRKWYMERVEAIKKIMPDCSLTTDIIAGFCTETEEDHQETLSLMKWGQFDMAYMFKYSERPNTSAARKYKDDVPDEVKTKRLNEIIAVQNRISAEVKSKDVSRVYEVLVEGVSKKSTNDLFGRTSHNKVVVFPKGNFQKGDYVSVKITGCTQATLFGDVLL